LGDIELFASLKRKDSIMATSITDTRDLFRQAIRAFQSVLEIGFDVQEESTRWFTQLLNGLGSTGQWHLRGIVVVDEAMAMSQETVEEAIRLMNQNATASLELLQKAFECRPPESYPVAQDKMQELWDSGLDALRTNIQSVVDANAQAMRSWAKTFTLLTDGVSGDGSQSNAYRGNGN
jgi:hypothetical protein